MSDLLARIDALTDEVLDEARRRKVDALMDSACPAIDGWIIGENTCGCPRDDNCTASPHTTVHVFEALFDGGSDANIGALRWQIDNLGPSTKVGVDFTQFAGKVTRSSADLLERCEGAS